MRPIRLEIEGFTSFRDRTVVDFEDADLFVLTGPTGAGKSSIIDAITFALYGSIPRLDQKLVAPVISRGMLQARVQLHFAVDKKRYTAVRVAKTTRTGATTPEARLEDDAGNTLADSAKELSDRVEEILGLSFDHFTRSVVLPQGDFAELLHESAGERQKMLRQLLGLELFSQLAARARMRGAEADTAIQLRESDIAQEATQELTDDGLKLARQRAEDLDTLVERIKGQQPESGRLQEKLRLVEQRAAEIGARLDLLAPIRVPEGVPELAERIAQGRRARDDAKEMHDRSIEERQRRRETLDKLPKEADLSLNLRRYDELAKAQRERAEAASSLEESRTSREAAQAEVAQARGAAEATEQAKRSMEDEHRAYHLASGLTAGDSCPVCRQQVLELPELDAPEEMEKVEAALRIAQQGWDRANEKLRDAQSTFDRQRQSLEDSANRVKGLEAELKDTDAREVIEAALKQVESASRALQEADIDERKDRDRLIEAEGVIEALTGEEKRAWLDYDAQRDPLAEMRPPAAVREDLAVAWGDLADWAERRAEEQRALHEEAKEEWEAAESALYELWRTIVTWCLAAGVEVGDDEHPLVTCSRELGRQQDAVVRIEQALDDLNRKRRELVLHRKEGQVAKDLAQHLGARRFERWLMGQVLEQLAVGASRELLKLSSDSYSLTLDERNDFVVVDHRNADEQRPVKTLSGGETFLASLALALSLSEQLADLAVGGAARLEALFLDEGFGTLDIDTLDVVITAIEELGSRGRMVGVVTHVKELAESIPVRYEVTKQGNRSSVARVEA
ncbi:MAG: SMC family ATPase [Truepera sp.]|nr:SMC family ATPase [Truepera sp.]